MSHVRSLNHAVLYVTDTAVSASFYGEVLGLVEVASVGDGAGRFLRAAGSDNDHDLGLFTAAAGPAAPPRAVGLYHLAWEVETLADLADCRRVLEQRGALVGASDHGATRSLYARDPDGVEFEIMWQVPLDVWDPATDPMRTVPLDLEADLDRFGPATRSRTVR